MRMLTLPLTVNSTKQNLSTHTKQNFERLSWRFTLRSLWIDWINLKKSRVIILCIKPDYKKKLNLGAYRQQNVVKEHWIIMYILVIYPLYLQIGLWLTTYDHNWSSTDVGCAVYDVNAL